MLASPRTDQVRFAADCCFCHDSADQIGWTPTTPIRLIGPRSLLTIKNCQAPA